MATEGRKKKKTLDDANDPPIIITGGGGVSIKRLTDKSGITIQYKDKDKKPKKDRAQNKDAADITGVRVEVLTTGINPPKVIDLNGVYTYTINIYFKTSDALKDAAPRPSGAGKGKTAATKRPAASKKSKSK
jgi:hypothetical protein